MDATRLTYDQPLYEAVNVYRIGETLVDGAHPANREELAADLTDGPLAGIERVVLTHPHVDHVGASLTLESVADLPHVVPDGVPEILADYNGYLERVHEEIRERTPGFPAGTADWIIDSYFPTGAYTESAIRIDRTLRDGDHVDVGPYECTVLETPGHVREHVVLWHEPTGTALSADLVSPNGHFLYGPLSADIHAYRDSLERLARLEPDRLLPGHGPPMDDPLARIEDALAKADRAESGIREAVTAAGEIRAQALARDVFEATDESVGFLTFVVCGYLEDLARHEQLSVEFRDDGVYAVAP